MPRSGDALNRAERWNSHLDRTARSSLGQHGQQSSDSVTQDRAFRFEALVQRVQGLVHRLGFIVRRGHVGTIRLGL
ncbi:hypothetical protein AMIS_1210 [Actinoplanes missouriensis 431]|uniref:Uncharacterized protein n=1 Tax=Actinoplanes missouriensis (strain ATCC 14538 / DSM 43046 / CBS 188.64 / JCM 3121 / NBRC 102363 / NCIMB 12654 / NRRL B-3342 / UNCC 431) TaxID=512565 RepID=I0GX54_ACTM4|nr:hypothetical protein AMIS_1210 [Actinoplanes missouriensis 431]